MEESVGDNVTSYLSASPVTGLMALFEIVTFSKVKPAGVAGRVNLILSASLKFL